MKFYCTSILLEQYGNPRVSVELKCFCCNVVVMLSLSSSFSHQLCFVSVCLPRPSGRKSSQRWWLCGR